MPDTVSRAPPSGGALSTLLNHTLTGMNTLGSSWIFVLVILICLDASGRKWFAAPIEGVSEMIELSLVGVLFLQLGDATRRGRLTRSDGLLNLMLRLRPRVGRTMGAASDLLGAVFMAIVIYGSVPLLVESIERDYYVGTEGVFTAPVWPVKLVIVIGCSVTLLQFLVFAVAYIRGTGYGPGGYQAETAEKHAAPDRP